MNEKANGKAWIVSADMGYGHQRTAYPLKHLAFKDRVITANNYPGIPEPDKKIWEGQYNFYNFISKFHEVPLIGRLAFKIFDAFQKIAPFYPRRSRSKSNTVLKSIYSLFKKGWGRDLIEKLKKENPNLPFVATFFIPAFMAEFFKYPGDIFCIVTDTDAARTWVPLNPSASRIKYLAPTDRVAERLALYGVKKENIISTGFPLPMENIGQNYEVIKEDLRTRILNLDPAGDYRQRYGTLIKKHLGNLAEKPNHPLTILFAVGGAGAQKKLAASILKGLKQSIEADKLKIILSAGTRKEVNVFFIKSIDKLKLSRHLGGNLEIIFTPHLFEFFRQFNQALRRTDILWTKPSELSFYAALGLPIIIAPAIGSQEDFNKEWLVKLGAGLPQKNPAYANQWLFDLLNEGWFAQASLDGFLEAEKFGVNNIARAISK